MKTKLIRTIAFACISLVLVPVSNAQSGHGDVYWHLDPGVKSCSMVIDPSLTQAQWKTFIQQVSPIVTMKTLSSAEPLGTMNFNVAIEYGRTPVDQHDLAWINTFTHPNADCPLGDEIAIPTIRGMMGVTDKMDIGIYGTSAPDANYGIIGGEVKYLLSRESESYPAAAVRGTATILTGVSDFDFSSYGVDLVASKKVAMFTPYVGLRGSVGIGTIATSKVHLEKESVFFAQGYAGLTCSVWIVNFSAEYNVSRVNTFAFAIGFNI